MFLLACGGYFYLPIACIFACYRQLCMQVVGKFAWVPHVKLPVKYPLCSNKYTCGNKRFACTLREVLAAETGVNLLLFTGKLRVAHINCMWGLFTCSQRITLRALADNFASVSFTVSCTTSKHQLKLGVVKFLETWLRSISFILTA